MTAELKPSCTFEVPPVSTIYWTDESWQTWIAKTCTCAEHVEARTPSEHEDVVEDDRTEADHVHDEWKRAREEDR